MFVLLSFVYVIGFGGVSLIVFCLHVCVMDRLSQQAHTQSTPETVDHLFRQAPIYCVGLTRPAKSLLLFTLVVGVNGLTCTSLRAFPHCAICGAGMQHRVARPRRATPFACA